MDNKPEIKQETAKTEQKIPAKELCSKQVKVKLVRLEDANNCNANSYLSTPRATLHSTIDTSCSSSISVIKATTGESGVQGEPRMQSSSRGRRILKARRSLPRSDGETDTSDIEDGEGWRSLRQEMIEREEDNVVEESEELDDEFEHVIVGGEERVSFDSKVKDANKKDDTNVFGGEVPDVHFLGRQRRKIDELIIDGCRRLILRDDVNEPLSTRGVRSSTVL
ncbi:unnamed protein product, partial [Leptidea sinapis]